MDRTFRRRGGQRRQSPLSPTAGSPRVACSICVFFCASTRVWGGRRDGQETLHDLLEVAEVGPTGREFHHYATRCFTHAGGNLDQPSAPGARLTFAQRVTLATVIVPTATLTADEGFGGNLFAGRAGAADRPPRDAGGPTGCTPPCAGRVGTGWRSRLGSEVSPDSRYLPLNRWYRNSHGCWCQRRYC